MEFSELIHPVTPETFFAEHYDRKPLHVRGDAARFAGVMSWERLNALLNMTGIWSAASLNIALDREIVPPDRYCTPAAGRDGREVLQPDADRVMALVRAGASLVCNDIDTLGDGLAGLAAGLERALGGKAQANLYFSRRERQAFDSHFDTHDVYAVHIAGAKTWRIYAGRAEAPIAHPAFKQLGREFHHRHRGAVAMEVTLQPGDLLYIPRGQYHDAVAVSDGTIHVAFGVTGVIGLDIFPLLQERAVAESDFRRNFPVPGDGEEAAAAQFRALAARIAAFAEEPAVLQGFLEWRRQFRYPRGGIALPAAALPATAQATEPPATAEAPAYRLRLGGLSVVETASGAVLQGRGRGVPIPAGCAAAVAWVLDRPGFAEADFLAAWPGLNPQAGPERGRRLLDELCAMKVLARQ